MKVFVLTLVVCSLLLASCAAAPPRADFANRSVEARRRLVQLLTAFLNSDGRRSPFKFLPAGDRVVLLPEDRAGVDYYVYRQQVHYVVPQALRELKLPSDAYLVAVWDKSNTAAVVRALNIADGVELSGEDELASLRANAARVSPSILVLNDMKLSAADMSFASSMHTLEALVMHSVEGADSARLLLPKLRHLELKVLSPASALSNLIEAMPTLEYLSGENLVVDGAAIAAISGLKHLRVLDLSGSTIDDAKVVTLIGALNLHELSVHKTDVTDAGLTQVRKQDELSMLNLSRCKISDQTLRAVAGLPKLTILNLNNTLITNRGIKYLSQAKRLQRLSLRETKCTGASVADLKKIRTLIELAPPESFGPAEVAQLRMSLPGCDVHR